MQTGRALVMFDHRSAGSASGSLPGESIDDRKSDRWVVARMPDCRFLPALHGIPALMPGLLQRPRQRKPGQWAFAYLAGAWVFLQGLDLIGHQFCLSDGLLRGITVALGVGFFATLVLAWYHGERRAQKITRAIGFIPALVSLGPARLMDEAVHMLACTPHEKR